MTFPSNTFYIRLPPHGENVAPETPDFFLLSLATPGEWNMFLPMSIQQPFFLLLWIVLFPSVLFWSLWCLSLILHRLCVSQVLFLFAPINFSYTVPLSVPQSTFVSLYLSHSVGRKKKSKPGQGVSAAQQLMEIFHPARSSSINWVYASRFPDHSLLRPPSRPYKTLEAKDTEKKKKSVTVPRANGLWNESAWPTCSTRPPHSGKPPLAQSNPEEKEEETCSKSESAEIRRACWMQRAQAKIFRSPVPLSLLLFSCSVMSESLRPHGL